jgi:hypothetical protein
MKKSSFTTIISLLLLFFSVRSVPAQSNYMFGNVSREASSLFGSGSQEDSTLFGNRAPEVSTLSGNGSQAHTGQPLNHQFDNQPVTYQFDNHEEEEDEEYEETPLRRFEIVFFISLPVSLLFSFAGASAYSLGTRGGLRFTTPEYGYILASAMGISLAIALHDQKVVYGD